MSRPSAFLDGERHIHSFFVFVWSVLVLDEREEGWGVLDVERRFGAVEPWSLSCLRMFFIGLCSGAISGRSVWQGNLVLLCFDVVV